MNVVYDCHIPEVLGYPERGWCFRSGGDAFLMWDGYFHDLLRAMWSMYGWEPDPKNPDAPNLCQVPLLRRWNESEIGLAPLPVTDLPSTAGALKDACVELRRVGPNLVDSPRHGEALAAFLEVAVAMGQSVSVEEWWG